MARLIQVIEVEDRRGKGTEEHPFRTVVQYFTTEGQLMAERDPWVWEELNEAAFTKDNIQRVRDLLTFSGPRDV